MSQIRNFYAALSNKLDSMIHTGKYNSISFYFQNAGGPATLTLNNYKTLEIEKYCVSTPTEDQIFTKQSEMKANITSNTYTNSLTAKKLKFDTKPATLREILNITIDSNSEFKLNPLPAVYQEGGNYFIKTSRRESDAEGKYAGREFSLKYTNLDQLNSIQLKDYEALEFEDIISTNRNIYSTYVEEINFNNATYKIASEKIQLSLSTNQSNPKFRLGYVDGGTVLFTEGNSKEQLNATESTLYFYLDNNANFLEEADRGSPLTDGSVLHVITNNVSGEVFFNDSNISSIKFNGYYYMMDIYAVLRKVNPTTFELENELSDGADCTLEFISGQSSSGWKYNQTIKKFVKSTEQYMLIYEETETRNTPVTFDGIRYYNKLKVSIDHNNDRVTVFIPSITEEEYIEEA